MKSTEMNPNRSQRDNRISPSSLSTEEKRSDDLDSNFVIEKDNKFVSTINIPPSPTSIMSYSLISPPRYSKQGLAKRKEKLINGSTILLDTTTKESDMMVSIETIQMYQKTILDSLSSDIVDVSRIIKTFIDYLLLHDDDTAVPSPFQSIFSSISALYRHHHLPGMETVFKTSLQAFLDHSAVDLIKQSLKQQGWKPHTLQYLGSLSNHSSTETTFVRLGIENGKIIWKVYHDRKWYKPENSDAFNHCKIQQLIEITVSDDRSYPYVDLLVGEFLTFKHAGKRTNQVKGTYLNHKLFMDQSRKISNEILNEWDVGIYQDLPKPKDTNLERDHIPQNTWLYEQSTQYLDLIQSIKNHEESIVNIQDKNAPLFKLQHFIQYLKQWRNIDDTVFTKLLNLYLKDSRFQPYLQSIRCNDSYNESMDNLIKYTSFLHRFQDSKRFILINSLVAYKEQLPMSGLEECVKEAIEPFVMEILVHREAISKAKDELKKIKKDISNQSLVITMTLQNHLKYSRNYMNRGYVTTGRSQNSNLQQLILDQITYWNEIKDFHMNLKAIGAFRLMYRQSLKLWKVDGDPKHDEHFIELLKKYKLCNPFI